MLRNHTSRLTLDLRFSLHTENRLENFAAAIIKFSERIEVSPAGNNLKLQLVRSATATALSYAETGDAESLRDFIRKLKITLRELRETQATFSIPGKAKITVPHKALSNLLGVNGKLIAILINSLKTCQEKAVNCYCQLQPKGKYQIPDRSL